MLMKFKAIDKHRGLEKKLENIVHCNLQEIPELDGGIVPGQTKLQNSWTLGLNQDPKTKIWHWLSTVSANRYLCAKKKSDSVASCHLFARIVPRNNANYKRG